MYFFLLRSPSCVYFGTHAELRRLFCKRFWYKGPGARAKYPFRDGDGMFVPPGVYLQIIIFALDITDVSVQVAVGHILHGFWSRRDYNASCMFLKGQTVATKWASVLGLMGKWTMKIFPSPDNNNSCSQLLETSVLIQFCSFNFLF